MTTIVAHLFEGVMVADSKTTDGDVKWKTKKIERIRNALVGAAGDCDDIEKFFRWLRHGGKKPVVSDFSGLMLNEDGVWLYDKKLSPYPAGREYHAVGTGAKAALAAILMGANAVRAVEIACEIDDGSGFPLQVHHLKERPDDGDRDNP